MVVTYQSVLRAYGLPDASVIAATHATQASLAAAVSEVLAADVSARDAEIVAAWLSAFAHHWPTAFAKMLGESGVALRKKCVPTDANRYLKLRRIAVENLSHIL